MDNTDKVLNIGLAQPLGTRIASYKTDKVAANARLGALEGPQRCLTRPAGRVSMTKTNLGQLPNAVLVGKHYQIAILIAIRHSAKAICTHTHKHTRMLIKLSTIVRFQNAHLILEHPSQVSPWFDMPSLPVTPFELQFPRVQGSIGVRIGHESKLPSTHVPL